MNKLGFQADSAQAMSQTKLQFRQRADDPTRLSIAFSSCCPNEN
ncbi:hypothetical protein ACQKM1_17190 [Peribacillus frigoritolerans]